MKSESKSLVLYIVFSWTESHRLFLAIDSLITLLRRGRLHKKQYSELGELVFVFGMFPSNVIFINFPFDWKNKLLNELPMFWFPFKVDTTQKSVSCGRRGSDFLLVSQVCVFQDKFIILSWRRVEKTWEHWNKHEKTVKRKKAKKGSSYKMSRGKGNIEKLIRKWLSSKKLKFCRTRKT